MIQPDFPKFLAQDVEARHSDPIPPGEADGIDESSTPEQILSVLKAGLSTVSDPTEKCDTLMVVEGTPLAAYLETEQELTEGVADDTQVTDLSQVTEREKLADVQHDIWSHWMRWQFSCCKVNQDGSLTIPSDKVERWQRQMDTSYSSLSDNEQESDRHQADKIIGVLDGCNVTDSSQVTDGDHSFAELYDHRHLLFALAAKLGDRNLKGWKSWNHHDGTPMYEGYFIAGLELPTGQISYHLPTDKWLLIQLPQQDRPPAWDGHTPAQVLERIEAYLKS